MTDEVEYSTLAVIDGDLAIDGNSFALLTNRDALADRLVTLFQLRLGSCVYDLTAGFDWGLLLGTDNPVLFDTLTRKYLASVDFITAINSIAVSINEQSRVAVIAFEVETTLGDAVAINFNTAV